MKPRIFTIKQKNGDYAEFSMIWRGANNPTIQDFKSFWGDLLYLPWRENEEIIELVPKA